MDKINLNNNEIWFITGSQHLYGEATLQQVAANSQKIVDELNRSGNIASKIVWRPTVKTQAEISSAIMEANNCGQCVGIICWMHTFSPAKMWINGLKLLHKPMLHLHTQANRDLPWDSIDMDFMNLNQAAHGDLEFGFICTRMNIRRKIVSGYYEDAGVQAQIDAWARVALAWADAQTMLIAHIGSNMRNVAVTEGNKVSAQIQFGYCVNYYGVADYVEHIRQVSDAEVKALLDEYFELYTLPDTSSAAMNSISDAARQEAGLRSFLAATGARGITTTFEDLAGLNQLPGLACQRIMADGYGFGAEGDWKTAALLRSMKVMAAGLPGGVSFMEDYTMHLEPGRERILGAHMLEVCPSIASGKPSLEVHPLGIGGKSAPARLVFTTNPGSAINATMVDLGDRYHLVVNEVQVEEPDAPLSKLPVASTVWTPKPNFAEAARQWIEAGGAHHCVHTPVLTTAHMLDFARMSGVETIVIGD